MVDSVKKQLTPKTFRKQNMNKSKGIFDDYAVRKSVQTRESEIQDINKSEDPLNIWGNLGVGTIPSQRIHAKDAIYSRILTEESTTRNFVGFTAGNVGICSFILPTTSTFAIEGRADKDNITLTGIGVYINGTGDLYFGGAGSGLPYGDLYVHANAVGQTISTATLTQVTTFDTAGVSNLTTPSVANSDITISKTGKYLITLSSAFSGDPNVTWLGGVYKNNGVTQLSNLQTKRKLGAGGDVGSISISGIASLTANDTVEVWFQHAEGVNKSITVEELTLSVVMVGG